MTWSYDETDLSMDTDAGRLNAVRLLIGDTDTNDQLLQDEEITFALSQGSDNIYYGASWACKAIATKFSRKVDTQLDGILEAKYSQAVEKYELMSRTLRQMALKFGGNSLGLFAGGLEKTKVDSVRQNGNRVKPSFSQGQFNNPPKWWTDDF